MKELGYWKHLPERKAKSIVTLLTQEMLDTRLTPALVRATVVNPEKFLEKRPALKQKWGFQKEEDLHVAEQIWGKKR